MAHKILFLDDDGRRRLLARIFYGEDVLVCETALEAMEALASQPDWDLVDLDHDLQGAGVGPQSSDDKTSGMEVVRWIDKYSPRLGLCIVHSWNEDAGRVMVHKLLMAGYSAGYVRFRDVR